MLRTSRLTKRYGSVAALDQVTLVVPAGSVFALLGPNGAGKTTFLRLVMGFVFPDSGAVDTGPLSAARIGYLPERVSYPPWMTVRRYLRTVGGLAGLRGQGLCGTVDSLLEQLALREHAAKRLESCSHGVQRRVGLAQALVGDPPLLLLDEPASGLDPSGQKLIRDRIVDMREMGRTVLLCSHHLGAVARVCSHVAVLDKGRLVQSGPLDAILTPQREVTILTGPIPRATRLRLADLGSGVFVHERRVILRGDAAVRKDQALWLLLQGEVDVRQLVETTRTLEEAFLEITG